MLLLGAAVPPALNWAIDPARVLSRDYYTGYNYAYPNLLGNVRFLKVAYVLDQPGRFDSFVFGSSRVRYGVPVDVLGPNWFKLDFPGAVLRELLPTLQVLVKKGVAVREVWLALDDFALYDVRATESDFFLRHYPSSLPEWLSFYRFYLYRRPSGLDWRILQRFASGEPLRVASTRIIGEREGIPVVYEDPAEHALDLGHRSPARRDMVGEEPRTDAVLETIESLLTYCRREGIAFRLFITPRHPKTLYYRDYDQLDEFKRRLAQITPFDDFAILNDEVRDARNWHEPSHFGPGLGARVVEAVRSGRVDETGLGHHVTRENADAHLRAHRARLVAALPEILADDPGLEIHESLLDPTPVFRASLQARSPLRGTGGLAVVPPASSLRFRSTAERSALVFAPIAIEAPDGEPIYLRIGIESRELGAVWLPHRLATRGAADGSARAASALQEPVPEEPVFDQPGISRWRFLQRGSNLVFAAVDAQTLRRGLVVGLARGEEYRISSLEIRRLARVGSEAPGR